MPTMETPPNAVPNPAVNAKNGNGAMGTMSMEEMATRITKIQQRLATEEGLDDKTRTELTKRVAVLEKKIVMANRTQFTLFPGVMMKLTKLEIRILHAEHDQNELQRAKLIKMKGKLEADLAHKQKRWEGMSWRKRANHFQSLIKRTPVEDAARRGFLQERLDRIQQRLDAQQAEKQRKLAARNQGKKQGIKLENRLKRQQNFLKQAKDQNDTPRIQEMERRIKQTLAMIAKRQNNSANNANNANKERGGCLAKDEVMACGNQGCSVETTSSRTVVVPEVIAKVVVAADVTTAVEADAIPEAAAPTTKWHPCRQRQKERMLAAEKKARANKNEEALNRIALNQVYVGHYPENEEKYISLFDHGGPSLAHKRAAMRQRALELARSSENGKDWIAADMYERLPGHEWTVENELAMFGNNNKGGEKNKQKPLPQKNQEQKERVNGNTAKGATNDDNTSWHPRREMQKKRTILWEKKARANSNEGALNRIALHQMYIGHYPHPKKEHYIPLFDKAGLGLLKKRAVMRQQALELARSEEGKDWIAADMYERLPNHEWTLEDEIVMFGSNKKQASNGRQSVQNLKQPGDTKSSSVCLDELEVSPIKKKGIKSRGSEEDNIGIVPHEQPSFSSDAAGNGDVADLLGETLDKCAIAIDDIVSELDKTAVDDNIEDDDDDDENMMKDDEESFVSVVPAVFGDDDEDGAEWMKVDVEEEDGKKMKQG